MPESGKQPQKRMLVEEEAFCWDTITWAGINNHPVLILFWGKFPDFGSVDP